VSEPEKQLEALFIEILDSLRVPKGAEIGTPTLADDARIRTNPIESCLLERKEIQKRVAQFKTHQLRFIKEREDYAASKLLQMRATLASRTTDAP
jgi:hypothetical protein